MMKKFISAKFHDNKLKLHQLKTDENMSKKIRIRNINKTYTLLSPIIIDAKKKHCIYMIRTGYFFPAII